MIHQDISDNYMCCVCKEPFDDKYHEPYIIPCGHNLCLKFIQKLKEPRTTTIHQGNSDYGSQSKDVYNKYNIKCPNCNESNYVTVETGFTKNIRLINMIQLLEDKSE